MIDENKTTGSFVGWILQRLRLIYFIILLTLGIQAGYALSPLESNILGDFSSRYEEKSTDPLDYIFQREQYVDQQKNLELKTDLALYRGFAQEGDNLENYCEERPEIFYSRPFEKTIVKKSFYSTLRYIGLDITSRALPKYAHYFEFSKKEYANLIENLVGNYCSQNVTVISLKQLRKNMMAKFNNDNSFKLPSLGKGPFFAKKIQSIGPLDKIREREFIQTVKLFRAFCSWGGEVDDLRLLSPIIKHPAVMSFLTRQMSGKKIDWDKKENILRLVNDKKTVQVYCENLICRRTNQKEFFNKIPRAVGSPTLSDDLYRLYCSEIRDQKDVFKNQSPEILEILKKEDFDDRNFLTAQFMALITGYPDFFIWSEKLSDGKVFLREGLDESWDDWALEQNKNLDRNIVYEEPLIVELVDRNIFFRPYKREFQVHLDVNLGEFDRVNQLVGKISTVFNLKVSKKMIVWLRNKWLALDPRVKGAREEILDRLIHVIEDDIKIAKRKFNLPKYRGNLAKIISYEILEQLALFKGKFYSMRDEGLVVIPISFNYAPFALKYLNFIYKTKENEKRSKELSNITNTSLETSKTSGE